MADASLFDAAERQALVADGEDGRSPLRVALGLCSDEDSADVTGDIMAAVASLQGFYSPAYPPTHPWCGTNPARGAIGAPGHCEPCAVVGHVVAHPERGCGDVGCNDEHRNPTETVLRDAVRRVLAATGQLGAEVPAWRVVHGLGLEPLDEAVRRRYLRGSEVFGGATNVKLSVTPAGLAFMHGQAPAPGRIALADLAARRDRGEGVVLGDLHHTTVVVRRVHPQYTEDLVTGWVLVVEGHVPVHVRHPGPYLADMLGADRVRRLSQPGPVTWHVRYTTGDATAPNVIP